MKYSKKETETIVKIFYLLAERNILYVVLNGYDGLPDYIDGTDIDILVHPKDFFEAKTLMSRDLNSGKNPLLRLQKIISRFLLRCKLAIKSPDKAFYALLKIFNKFMRLKVPPHQKFEDTSPRYLEAKFLTGNLEIHLVNHLAYKSPKNGKKIRVDPRIEELLFQHRKKRGEIYVPSPPEELTHLICKGLFDKKGEFPDYYLVKLSSFSDLVLNTKDLEERFREITELLFFKADSLIYDNVKDKKFEGLKQKLLKFSGY